MSTRRGDRTDSALRTAAWFYVARRALTLLFVLGAVGLAVFMVVMPVAMSLLERAGVP